MTQLNRISKNNTTIHSNGTNTVVTLHGTDIVTFSDKHITLYNGGFVTATTATRMNQVSNEYRLGYGVSRKNGCMTVSYNGVDHPMDGGLCKLRRV